MTVHTPSVDPLLSVELATKYDQLRQALAQMESVLVAYSGGVDSALLLAVATDVLGNGAVGALATSPAYDEEETAEAIASAREMGARVEVVSTSEVENPAYAVNGADRCYFCKVELFDVLAPLAQRLGLATIAYGMNRDDRGDWRPGQRAARERGVRAPLDEAGLTKADIRALARSLGLSMWDKPSLACFSSRIPYGTPVTVETLARIGKAERALRRLGFRQVRVRHHGEVARIEVEPEELGRFLDAELREQATEALRAAGYTYVTLDLRGYRTGAMNETLLRRAKSPHS